ncbi:MAG: SUMF1/EgtB/PvdO family nonheme iron enzyme [Gammaproteobacteria bacterium]|nr:SUMF1/EgtB/PvdO family nonheme iron enzyme [Gammaproteobacteria bacterium]
MPTDHKTPRVFVSSTAEDLKEFRAAVAKTLLSNDCFPVMFEYWEGADNPPLKECLERVDNCDLVLAVVAKRHGWTPADQETDAGKSITRLECERAFERKIPIIPFLVDDEADWPVEQTENYRLTAAADKGNYTILTELGLEIKRNQTSLTDFRQWLSNERQRCLFSTPEGLQLEITGALNRWRREHPEFQPPPAVAGFNRTGYRDWLCRRCESVELLGLDQKDAHNVRLQQVYVPAMVVWDDPDPALLKAHQIERPNDLHHETTDKIRINLPLLHRLACHSLYVPGAPGAGKSTFCRWLALIAASDTVPQHPIPAPDEYLEASPSESKRRIPVLCYLRDLNDHKELLRGSSGSWTKKELEDTLAKWLDKTQPGGLNGTAWRDLIKNGDCLMILDGVDELQTLYKEGKQSHRPRSNFLSGLADALPHWQRQKNRILLTSRPYGVSSADQQRLGLEIAELQPLDEPLQHTFIRRWFAAVDPPLANEKSEGLIQHLAEREDLRELRASPMLLTALCIKYDEGKRLPHDIHILYHSVINQVLHGRYHDTADQQAVRRRLAVVALGMHTGDAIAQARSTPKAAVGYPELESILAAYAGEERASEGGANNAAENREDLISQSGLLLPRGEEQAGFYHLSFQEYLAAERLRVLETDLATCLRKYAATPEWRRTLMFLFCALAEIRPQAALDAAQEVLLPSLDIDAIQPRLDPALLLFDCLEIAYARHWTIEEFTQPLWRLCTQSLSSSLTAEIQNTLWLAAGKLGIDQRPGVGLDASALPDVVWCPVAPGRVALENDAGQFDVAGFAIAKYPVTNIQFQAFIDAADGYQNSDWWTPEQPAAGRVDPKAPRSSHWIEPNAPRESVTWYEAVAFCRWLDHQRRVQGTLDPDRQIRLPTEWEWQQAATGGKPDRIYPWGPDWEPGRLNAEGNISRTTAAGIYLTGQSPCEALDMAGNVWEWCLNKYDPPEVCSVGDNDLRVLRGGAWFANQDDCRAADRGRRFPDNRNSSFGFRLCLSSPIKEC